MAVIHLLFKIVNLKILENSQEYIYSEVIFFIKLLNAKLLMLNFSAEIFIFEYFKHWFKLFPSKHFNITRKVSRLASQVRNHRLSKQQPLRGEIFKILKKGGEPYIGGLRIYGGTWEPFKNHSLSSLRS